MNTGVNKGLSLRVWAGLVFVAAGVVNLFLRDFGMAVTFLAVGVALFAAGDASEWSRQPLQRRIATTALLAIAAIALVLEILTTWVH